jgi:hypothetical protein
VDVVSFFEFAENAYEQVKHQRRMLRSALGYCIRQKVALVHFLDDGVFHPRHRRYRRRIEHDRAAAVRAERISVPVASLEAMPTLSRRPLSIATHSAILLGSAVPVSLRWLQRLGSRRSQASERSD